MVASSKGGVIAALTVLVVAAGAATLGYELPALDCVDCPNPHLFELICITCILPALVIGGALGDFSERLRGSPDARWIVLATLACGCTAVLGAIGQLPRLIVPACVTVMVATSVLERWTRPHDLLPVARVRRHARKFSRPDER